MAGRIAELGPDLIVLSIHSGPTAKLLNELTRLGVKAPVLILLGRVASVTRNLDPAGYGGAIAQIAREGVPNVYPERLRAHLAVAGCSLGVRGCQEPGGTRLAERPLHRKQRDGAAAHL